MKKIIYADDDEAIREIVALKLASLTSADIEECEGGEEAVKLLSEGGVDQFSVVISDFSMPDGDGAFLYQALRDGGHKLPFILLTAHDEIPELEIFKTFTEDHPGNGFINKMQINSGLKEIFLKATSSADLPSPADYQPISLRLLKRFTSSPVNLYIKLSDKKYLCIFHSGSKYTDQDILKYEMKQVEQFWCKKEDNEAYTGHCINALAGQMQETIKKGNVADTQAIQMDLHQVIHQQMVQLGITQHTCEVIAQSLEATVQVISSSKGKLAELFFNLKADGRFIYHHSLMANYIAGAILDNSEWRTKDTMMKISLASFMHDIAIEDNELAEKFDLSYNMLEDLSEDDNKSYQGHAFQGAEMLKEMSNMPADVDVIVSQHHELPDGSGFPRGLSALHISPLSATFIIAHRLTEKLYNQDVSSKHLQKMLKEMEPLFSRGNFKKPFASTLKVFK